MKLFTKRRMGEMYPWFAWYPVMLWDTREVIWWEWIERSNTVGIGRFDGHQYQRPEVGHG